MQFGSLKWYFSFGVVVSVMFLLAAGCSSEDAEPVSDLFYENPEDVSVITSDVSLFWKVFDASENSFDAETFRIDYFGSGTKALGLFFDQKVKNASKLSNVLNNPDIRNYYLDVRPNTENLDNATSQVFSGFSRLKQLYSEAVFSDIVFVIGALSTGGTVVKNGQMVIGTEMFSVDENTPLAGLNEWQRTVVKNQTFLPSIIIHELIHVQQFRLTMEAGNSIVNGKSLLDQSLSEGIADFVTDLILGSFFNDFIHEFADPIEADLWKEFELEMNGTDVSRWLYNGLNLGDRPGDLGYYIGYKIAEHFYNKADDKTAALKTILEVRNGEDFLALSGYADKFD